jgi:hypothetical protein
MTKNTFFAYFLVLDALSELFLLNFFLKQLLMIVLLSIGDRHSDLFFGPSSFDPVIGI